MNTELRDSGRDLVQINDDGTHAILPVATHVTCKLDHAGLPVMWLRHADGKLRRYGIPAALMQRRYAVDERGRVHGAPGLAAVVAHRVQARRRGPCRKRERKREWVRSSTSNDRLRGRDKRGSPVGPQAIDMAWVLACRSVGARAAPCVFTNAINDNFGTVAAFDRPEAWR